MHVNVQMEPFASIPSVTSVEGNGALAFLFLSKFPTIGKNNNRTEKLARVLDRRLGMVGFGVRVAFDAVVAFTAGSTIVDGEQVFHTAFLGLGLLVAVRVRGNNSGAVRTRPTERQQFNCLAELAQCRVLI